MATTRVSDLSNLILAGSDEVFNKAAKKPINQQWKNIVREKVATKRAMNYDTVGALNPAQVHGEDSAVTFNKIEYNNRTTITSYVYENGVKASLEASEFDLYDVVKAQFGDPLVATMNDKKEEVVAAVYNTVASATGADGVYLASDSHPLKNNALLFNDNLITGALDTATLMAGKNRFNHIYTQSGKFFNTEATHLLIHPNKMFLALQLLNSQLMALELSNTKNTVNDVAPIKIIQNKYLTYNTSTDVSPWFLLDKTLDAGCVLQTNKGLTLKSWFDYEDLTLKGVAYEIYGCGMVAPGYGFCYSSGA